MSAAPINGQSIEPAPPPEPKTVVAREVYALYAEDGDAPFDELPGPDRDSLEAFAVAHISAHMAWLQAHGFRILPPGAVLRPKSDEEAAAMLEGVKLYHAAKTRKPGLIGSLSPRKVILPRGTKLQ